MSEKAPNPELLAKLAKLAYGESIKGLPVVDISPKDLGTNTTPKEVAVGTGVSNAKEREGRS